jgi:hypothetical protein
MKLMPRDWYEEMAEKEWLCELGDASEANQWSFFYLLICEAYEDL